MTALKKPVPFGKYYLLDRISVGGMAEVFKAKSYGVEGFESLSPSSGSCPNIAEDDEFIKMFIDEAKIAVQLQHANIGQIFELGRVDDATSSPWSTSRARTCSRSSTAAQQAASRCRSRWPATSS